MAGGHVKYRHLSRSSAHRQALLRNLVTSLFKHESIATTWHKAKEAQRLAEKLVTLGKKNTEATRRRARQIFYEPNELVPKLFGPIRQRYANRTGGYTRVLRIEPMKEDQAESAILELVDGPKDMRYHLFAKTLSRLSGKRPLTPQISHRIKQATQFRKDGVDGLLRMVERMRLELTPEMEKDRILPPPRKVYPEEKLKRELHYFEDVKNYKFPNVLPKSKLEKEMQPSKPAEEANQEEQEAVDSGPKQLA